MLEYLEDCNEDANQTDCVADCEYDPSYAWCALLDKCDMEVTCCKEDCEANDSDDDECTDDCDSLGYSCKASPIFEWSSTTDLACKQNICG